MDEIKTIPKKLAREDALDYAFLRREAIEYLQEVSGSRWTDYNLHDPGVTLLEILCFAINDLAFRLQYTVPEIIALSGPNAPDKSTLYPPEQIFPNTPITAHDYATIFMGHEEVRNVSIVPAPFFPDFQGLYQVELELEHKLDWVERQKVRDKIMNNYYQGVPSDPEKPRPQIPFRNLAEDLAAISFKTPVEFAFEMDLVLDSDFFVFEVIEEVFCRIRDSISPIVQYSPRRAELEKGKTMEEVFQGAYSPFGVLPREYATSDRLITVQEIIGAIMHAKGILEVRDLKMKVDGTTYGDKKACFRIPTSRSPVLDQRNSTLTLYTPTGKFASLPDLEKVVDLNSRRILIKDQLSLPQKTLPPEGLADYVSIQEEFPPIYGVGTNGPPAQASNQRTAQARQWQGYLLFFDQIMAAYLHELRNLGASFSTEKPGKWDGVLANLPGAPYLCHPFVMRFLERHGTLADSHLVEREWVLFLNNGSSAPILPNPYEESYEVWSKMMDQSLCQEQESPQDRTKMLDHLLARFAIKFDDDAFTERAPNWSLRKETVRKSILGQIPLITSARSVGINLLKAKGYATLEKVLYILMAYHDSPNAPIGQPFKNHLHIRKRVRIDEHLAEIDPNSPPELNPNGFNIMTDDPEQAITDLFYYGQIKSNYDTNDPPILTLFKEENGEKKIIARIPRSDMVRTPEDAVKQIKNLAEKTVPFYLVENIVLRPSPFNPVYLFELTRKGLPQKLRLENPLSLLERKEILKKFVQKGKDEQNYILCKRPSHDDFYLLLEVDGIRIISGFFSDENAANAAKKLFSESCTQLYGKTVPQLYKSPLLRFFTHLPNCNLSPDPYSNTISLVLPKFDPRFRKENLRGLLQELVYRLAPAHLQVNFCWMGIRDYKKFAVRYAKFLKLNAKMIPYRLRKTTYVPYDPEWQELGPIDLKGNKTDTPSTKTFLHEQAGIPNHDSGNQEQGQEISLATLEKQLSKLAQEILCLIYPSKKRP